MTKLEKFRKREEEEKYNNSIEGLYNKGLLTNEDIELFIEIEKSFDYSFVGVSAITIFEENLKGFLDRYEDILTEEIENKVKDKWDFWRGLCM